MSDNLYDALQKLLVIPDAFDAWKPYRDALTDHIISCSEPGTSAAVVGAGACNDLDLKRLSAHFAQVILLDRDLNAMVEGLERQQAEQENITLETCDLVGISAQTYRKLADSMVLEMRMQSACGIQDGEELAKLFLDGMVLAVRNRRPTLPDCPIADYVICCGVHSQLFNLFPQMAAVLAPLGNMSLEQIYFAASAHAGDLARELNRLLRRMAKREVILGLETGRVGTEGGIEGADQALRDIWNHNLPLYHGTELIWPFDMKQGKVYSMTVFSIPGTGD